MYRLIDGRLQLVPLTFTEDWPLVRRREKAREILRGTHIVYGAVETAKWSALSCYFRRLTTGGW